MKAFPRHCLSLGLALVLLCSPLTGALAADSSQAAEQTAQPNTSSVLFSDVSDSDWFQTYVNLCVDAGLLTGVGDGLFGPFNTIQVGEALVMAARVLWLAEGGTGPLPQGPEPEEFMALLGEDCADCPFAVDAETAERYAQSWAWDGMTYLVLKAHQAGVSLGLETAPDYPASRRLFFKALAFAAQGLDLPAINDVSAVPGTRDGDILELYRAGILTGADAFGALDGQRTLTRADAAAALARVVEPSLRVSFTPAPSPYQGYTLTKLTDGTLFAGGPSTGLCAVETENGVFFLTLEGELLPWPEGGTPSSALNYYLDYVEIGTWTSPEAAEAGYGDIAMGLLDKNGDYIIPLGNYDRIQPAQDGTFLARKGAEGEESWFLLDSGGTQIAQLPQLEGADWSNFNDGLLPLRDPDSGLYGFVDQTGAWVLSPQWQDVSSAGFSGGYVAVQDSRGLWGVIDSTGTQILSYQYQWIVCPDNSPEYVGPVLFLIVDTAGEMMWIDPEGTAYPADPSFAYTSYDSYHNGYAVWWADDGYYYPSCCYLDLSGQVLTEAFDWAGPIGADGRGFVGLDGAVYRITFTQEQVLIPVQPDDTQEVLGFVDDIFAVGEVSLQCWLFPGTGPISLSMDDYYGQVRELFAARTWVRQEGQASSDGGGDWSLQLSSSGPVSFSVPTDSNCITVTVNGADSHTLSYTAQGDADDLALDLTALWEGPEVCLALALVEGETENEQALGEAYVAAFQTLYRAQGAITDFQLEELSISAAGNPEPASPVYHMAFSVKPADPSAPCWKGADISPDGWVSFSYRLGLAPAGDNAWRCAWFQ